MFDSIKKGIKSAYKKGKKAVTNLGKKIFGGSSSSGGSSTHRSSSGSTHGGSSGTTHGGSSGSFGRSSYVSRSPRYSGPAARSYGANTVTNQARSGASRSNAGVNQISRNSSAYNSSASTSYNSRRGSRSDTTHNSNSGSFADRNPHALSTDAKKNQEEVAGNIKRFGAGVGKRYFGSQMYGLKDSLQDAYKAYMKTGLLGSREIPFAVAIDKFAYEKTVGKANKNLSLKHLDSVTDRVLKKYGSKLQESGEKDIESLKKNSGAAGKWGIDLAAGAAELGLDVGLTRGRGTMAAMYNRAYGSAKKTAIDEGATEKQAKLYGQVIGGIEVGTEKISSVAAPLRKLYGKGATDELTDRVIDKIVSKTTSKAGKNIAYHGAKTVASAIGEGLEEMVSEGLDPVVANTIYANAVGKPHSTSAKDILYAGSIGAALGGVLGGGGQVVEYNRGKKVLSAAENNMFGEGGIKSLINEAKTADEDTGDNVKAQAYDELVNTGQGIVAGQANELYSSVQSQRARDDQRYGIAMRASDNMIKKNGYVPVVGVDNEGNAKIADNTRSTYEKYSAFNTEVIKGEMQLPEAQSKEIAAAVSEIQTGIADTSTVNMFTTANPEARTAYERITGETLPDTNQGTRAYLYEKLAENRVESARAETEYFKDTMKGLIQQDVTPTYDTAGQEAFSRGMENVNVGNGNDVSNYIVSFEHFYEAGRTGLDYSDVAKTKNPAYESVSSEIKKSAYEAGVRDRIDGADNVKGMQIKIGQTLKESRSNGRNKARRGKVISELSKEGKKRVSASAQAVYRTLARTFNLEIHLVEDIAGTNANGFYKDGVMYLNINADRPLSYVFSHEITHHMQQYAPEQYAMFKQLVREKWFQQGGIEDAISQKIIQYRGNGVELTREEALDEILADSTYEIIQSQEFIDELCRENRSLAQSVLDAVRNVIDKLRAMIAEGQGFAPKYNESLLSELDILKDAAKLWTDGLMVAAQNRAAVGVNETSEGKYSIEQDSTGKDVVVVQEDIFKGREGEKRKKVVTEYLKNHIGDMFTMIENGKNVYLGKDLPNEYNHSKTTERLGKEKRFAKQKATPGIGEMVEIATNERWESPVHKEKHEVDAKYGFYKYDTRFAVRDRSGEYEIYDAELVVRHDADGKLYLYDVQGIKKDTAKVRFPLEESQPDLLSEESKATTNGTSINSIPESEGNDKKFSFNENIFEKSQEAEGRQKFSLKEPIEETKDLIAVHNLNESELSKTLRLGGFPMPSIAVIKDDFNHSEYGSVSVLFSKDTIDPAVNKDNEVYSSDAWTPTYPTIEFKVNSKASERIYDKIMEMTKDEVPESVRSLLNHFNPGNIEDELNRHKGETGLFETYQNDPTMKNVYLADKGKAVYDVYTKTEKHFTPEELKEIKEYIAELGGEKAAQNGSREEWTKAVRKVKGISEGKKLPGFLAVKEKRKTLKYLKDGESWTEENYDYDATIAEIEKKTNQSEYEAWLKDLFRGIEEKSGIRNNKALFDDMGNRRDFDELHYEESLENVVKAMREEENGGAIFAGQNIWSAATRKYENIDDIKGDSDRLLTANQEEYDKLRSEYTDRLQKIVSEIMDHDTDNDFMARDNAAECIIEAVRYSRDADDIYDYLQDYPQLTVTEADAQDIAELIEDIAAMPTEYLEAKPRRAVGFDEVKAVIAPDNIDPDLKTAVEDAGIQIYEYAADNNEDRLSKVNVAAEENSIKFSFAGDNALNADNKMLKKAKEMYNDFESSETIRKETGWHLGTDGKWRFEIDDSQMKVFASGDALFRKEHPEYTRLQELYDKFWNGTITDAEQKEFTDLNKTWGGELARLRTRLQRGNARLADIIQHDVLFENYPQLEDVRIKLGNLDRATGAYAVNGSEIMIDEDLFRNEYQEAKRDGTLIHEIQHAIQDIEGFAMGANFDMINAAISATEDEVRAADKRYDSAADDLLDALDEAGYFNKYGEDIDITSEDALSRIRDEYRDTDPDIEELVDELEDSQKDLQESQNKLRELRDMSPVEFYKYAAGEVEARDTANRLNYGEGERRATRPDIDSPSIKVEDYVRFSLKNENLSPSTRIPYTIHQSYISVKKNDNAALKNLQDNVRKLKRGTYENKATGYKADIIGETIGKIISPSRNKSFNRWSKKYIDNLNAATQLPELFENAVYVDTKGNQKAKKANQQIKGYHHFVAPIYMDGKEYRARIVAREKKNSDTLYIVETEIMPIKNGSSVGRSKASQFVSVPSDISIPELVNGVKIYDYNMQKNDIYNQNDIKYSLPDESNVLDYINESEGEFYDVPPMRYYEIRQKQVKLQTYDELQKLCEKLKADKKLTHGKVLDKSSVTEQMNDLVRCLMTYSESYSLRGNPRKVKSELVKFAADKASIIFRAIKNGDYTTAMNTAYLAATDIVESLDFVDDANFYEYKELRDYLRTTRMAISEEDMSSIPDFAEFKKDQFGRLRIVKENGISVDQVYGELCEMYPELFDTEITNPADQLMKIADVRESLEPYDMMLAAEETEQLKKQTAQDLMEISALGKPWKSWADKKKEDYDARLKLVKTRHQEAVREIRRKERARADERIAAEKEKAKQKIQQEKQRSSEKLQEEKQKSREKLQQERVKSQEKVQAEKDKARAKEAKRKTLRERAKSFGRIKKNYDWLCERLVKPTDDKHIPHAFTEAVADLLMCFDLQTERSKQLQEKRGYKAQTTIKADELRNRISRVKERFAELAPEDDTGIFEYDGYVFDLIDSLEKKLEGKERIDTLSDEDLAAVDILLKSVVHNISNYNKFFNENIKAGIDEIGKGVIESADAKIKARGKNKVERGGTVGDLLNESNITSRDLFERMGGGMETMYMGLRSGFDKHIDNITELREFFEDLFKGYHKKKKPGSKIQRWRNSKGLKTVRLESGEDIKISVAQIMSLYCSSKREQALGHILEGGIVLTEVKRAGKFREAIRGKRGLPGTSTKITYNDVQNIISQLTSEQRSMADKLQGFLNGRAAEWGNEASMKMYGYEKFTEKDYFPIKSSRTWLATNAETVNPKEKIRNFGFTKNTVQGANNTIVIDDIFTVFADHVNKMSQYNALAPAIADFMKVYNYTDKSAGGLTVKGKISDAWGRRYQRYIERFMADLQSNFDMKTEGIGRFMAKSLANYKRAAIGFNLRVAVQQPTAIARAFLLINPVYFVSKNHTPSALKKMMRKDTEYKDMIDHCPIARWKSWGNTQVDMARDIDAIMMNEEWTRADLISMEIYGVLDNYTWSKIWGAVRAETKAKHKDVEVDSEEFYRICNERASEIFDKTQVVDSVFHRSQAMRNTDAMSKTLTSFMAEPTRTYNMMKTAYGDAVECWQNKHKVKAVGKFIGASNVFLINAAAVSAAAAVADALRGKQPGDDDDEDKEGFDLWLANAIANFWDNANPLSMIPIVKDIWSFKDGWGSSNMGLEGFAQVMESGQAILDKIGGGSDKDWNELMRDFAEGMGYVTGRPVKNILREYDVIQTKLMSAFAAEAGGEDTASKGKEWINSTLDKLSGKSGKSDENEKDGSGSDRGIVDKLVGKMDIEDGSTLDNVLNKVGLNLTDEERAAREKKKMLSDVESQISGLDGDERNEKLWKAVTKNYTNYVNDGNIDELKRMRSTLKEFDGDVDKFDKAVIGKIQTAFKKNIGEKGDPDKLQIYRDYLKDRGYTDGKISQEIIAKSDTAKEYQKALCLNDEEAAGKYLSELSLAGLTYESYSLLFDNRSKAIKGADYSSGEFAFPVNGEITSGFGGRQSPGGIGSTDHKGIDIGVVTGTSVAAADGGKVSLAGWNGGYGNCVIIDHGNGRQTLYGHLEGYTVQAGDVVGKGQEIGKSGSTGNSTGPHLHFGVKEGGRFVDPMSYFR